MMRLHLRHLRPSAADDASPYICIICDEALYISTEGGASYERLSQCARCAHVMHRKCLAQWWRARGDAGAPCPICRAPGEAPDEASWELAPEVVQRVLDERDRNYEPPSSSDESRRSRRQEEQRIKDRIAGLRSAAAREPPSFAG